jgi:NADH-quinone oxidoreductase subunit J
MDLVAENVFFFAIAAMMIVGAIRVVTTRNIVHAALWLVLVLAGAAGQYILLVAEFTAVVQVLVYIGAIVVLFLFGIMLTRAPLGDSLEVDRTQSIYGAFVGGAVLLLLGFTLIDSYQDTEVDFAAAESPVALAVDDADDAEEAAEIAEAAETDTTVDVQVGDDESPIVDAEEAAASRRGLVMQDGPESFSNTKMVSDSIFSDYLIAFEAISVLLLAALIGAIVLARGE